MKLAVGTVVAERFRLVKKLGEGGMGEVWLTHHVKLDTPCAVKFIHADVASASDVRERFEREAKIAAQIRSPHVVHVLDYGVSEGVPYIAMEYLEGEDLAARLDARGRLSPEETALVIGHVARALTKAHAAGLVHRDLKPENVFLVRDDDQEIAKVLDFGIAKTQTPMISAQTRTGAMMGTPRFMSPEQAQGMKSLDYRSDLWSLAVIAFRCVVGTLPFDSDSLGDLMMRIIVHPLPVPSQILPGLPPAFDAWWTRAASREPAQRFQSAKELAEALASALGVAPVVALAAQMGAHAASSAPTPGLTRSTPPPANMTPPPASAQRSAPALTPPPSAQPIPNVTPHGAPSHQSEPQMYAPVPGNTGPAMMPAPVQTMNPASRTYGGETKRKGGGVLIGALLVVSVAAAVVITLAVTKRSNAGPENALSSGVTAAPAPPTVEPAVVASDAPPTVAPATSTQPAETAAATSRPAGPRVRPPPPPAPARTRKVQIGPPPH